jgi:hypothetical protein
MTAIGLPSISPTASEVMLRSETPLAASAVKSDVAPT